MRIRILGSAAGGGFPQWNCNCRHCRGVRDGSVRTRPRTQSSIAVSRSEHTWALINASPDILVQLRANEDLQPARTLRDTGLAAIVLTDAQIDHSTGLLMLREANRQWPLWCTDSAYQDLTGVNPILNVLAHYCGVTRYRIEPNKTFAVDPLDDISFTALPISSKPAPYSPGRNAPRADDNIALRIVDLQSGGRLFYAPGLGAMDEFIWQRMQASDCVLVDGTFYTDDEMIRLGLSNRTAREIGHLPLTGSHGMLEWLERLPAATRKILIHVNNTNPILDEDSPERALLVDKGIEVAHDGMEIVL